MREELRVSPLGANRARVEEEGTAEASARTGVGLSLYPLISADGRDGGIGLAATLRF